MGEIQAVNPEVALAEAIRIAESAQSKRDDLEAKLVEEREKSKQARQAVAQSDENLRRLDSQLGELRALNHQEGSILLGRARDFSDKLREKAEAFLFEAKNLKGQAVNELQSAQDKMKAAIEKEVLVNNKGKDVLAKLEREQEAHKLAKAALDKDCNALASRKGHMERDLAALNLALENKKKLLAEVDQALAAKTKKSEEKK